jgi:hypothetical protein
LEAPCFRFTHYGESITEITSNHLTYKPALGQQKSKMANNLKDDLKNDDFVKGLMIGFALGLVIGCWLIVIIHSL